MTQSGVGAFQLKAARYVPSKDSDRLPSRAGAPPGVECLGFVPDLDGLYARSRIVCSPIMQGGGTRVKLVEAAGYANRWSRRRSVPRGSTCAARANVSLWRFHR